MRKIIILFLIMIITVGCGNATKKRKACRGNGSWYGNRNL